MPVTYSNYLKLDQLLDLQQTESQGREHDEMLFIIIHQVYELWFKEVLHELDYLQRSLESNQAPPALNTLKRVLTVLKIMVAQIDILETMSPIDFLSFRERLESGSGFQSYQFRMLEYTLGQKRPAALDRYPDEEAVTQGLQARFRQPSLWDSFLAYLAKNGYDVPKELLQRDTTQSTEPSPDVQKILIDIYHNDPAVAQLCERLVDLDEGLQEWRYRHVKMVERTIGTKPGTGGSTGAKYLKTTLFDPVFPDLWAIRTEL